MLRCLTAVVLDYWKQEMAVTGDETESGRVSLTLFFYFICVTCKSLCLLERSACTACAVSDLFRVFPLSLSDVLCFTTESQIFHSSDLKKRCFSRSETFKFESLF